MYHFQINGIDVTCETAEELHACVSFWPTTSQQIVEAVTNFEPLHADKAEQHKQNGHIDGRTEYHQRVARYAKRHGLTHLEARRAMRKAAK